MPFDSDNINAAQMPQPKEVTAPPMWPLRIPASLGVRWTADEFFDFCQINKKWRIERDAHGGITILEPAGWESGTMSGEGFRQTANWSVEDTGGKAADASTGFTLPNKAVRSPDAAWVSRSRLDLLPKEQRKKFLPLCPDFALEVTSPTDSLAETKDKMSEYIENGLRIGVLIHPPKREVWVYRPGVEPVYFSDPATVSCEPEMPGFTLDIQKILNADD